VQGATSRQEDNEQWRQDDAALSDLCRPQKSFWLHKRKAMKTYPSKELCLRLAEYHCETTKDEKTMWIWLITWAFHEMYIDGWITK
jgi:hypothetical protein